MGIWRINNKVPHGVRVEDIGAKIGDRRYYWGRGCSNAGHHDQGRSLRYSSSSNCVYCQRAANQKNRGTRGQASKMLQIDAANEERQLEKELSAIDGWDFT